jgi:transaldolase
MKFFIDSANIKEIKELYEGGLIHGVTTNPSLVAKQRDEFYQLIKEISQIVDGPISAEVLSEEFEEMYKEAYEIAKINHNVVIKLPLTKNGIRLCKILSNDDIDTNMTLCFSVNQALLAANAGAKFVSPFIGRINDIGGNGMGLIADIYQAFSKYNYHTEILAASIRSPEQVGQVAMLGADAVTIPYDLFDKIIFHPLTLQGLEKFRKDWESYKK